MVWHYCFCNNDAVERNRKGQINMEAPVACHFVNICQMSGISRTCFHCILKTANLDIADDRFLSDLGCATKIQLD